MLVSMCSAFMRKFCADTGYPEPTERAINQTFSHQINYARRRPKPGSSPSKRPKHLVVDEHLHADDVETKPVLDTEQYIQM